MTKGFKWNGWVKGVNMPVDQPADHAVYAGNFFLELKLPNALKIKSFEQLKVRLDKYVKSHGDKYPNVIRVTHKQREQYISLHPSQPNTAQFTVISFNGVPMYLYE